MDSRATYSNAPDAASSAQQHWQAEYKFWTDIISDEVARLRWNEGFEPLQCDLYELKNALGERNKFVGITRICGRDFECTVYQAHDAAGTPVLKLSIRVSTPKHY